MSRGRRQQERMRKRTPRALQVVAQKNEKMIRLRLLRYNKSEVPQAILDQRGQTKICCGAQNRETYKYDSSVLARKCGDHGY